MYLEHTFGLRLSLSLSTEWKFLLNEITSLFVLRPNFSWAKVQVKKWSHPTCSVWR